MSEIMTTGKGLTHSGLGEVIREKPTGRIRFYAEDKNASRILQQEYFIEVMNATGRLRIEWRDVELVVGDEQ